ncbi:hypothetical protein NDU88_007127 [Pleurodeles waltl]|uniref:Uncharacterized protein n=1 Tax=Pleurodeles waltl TaxID=8319 RepID=A0AAV7UR12_PLEWA|nr:hypothetical protein NDU88_007127 [Pleurodeles waltl]
MRRRLRELVELTQSSIANVDIKMATKGERVTVTRRNMAAGRQKCACHRNTQKYGCRNTRTSHTKTRTRCAMTHRGGRKSFLKMLLSPSSTSGSLVLRRRKAVPLERSFRNEEHQRKEKLMTRSFKADTNLHTAIG